MRMRNMLWSLGAGLLLASSAAHSANYCGALDNAYGPFDHRKRNQFTAEFKLVEDHHFTSRMEEGHADSNPGANIDYTLRAIPNHPRALTSMGRLATRSKSVMVKGARYPAECYFERAVRFAPDDGAVRAIYANFLTGMGRHKDALDLFAAAVALLPEDPAVNYNAGLAYFKAKNYVLANRHAQKAYALGFPLPGLRTKLKEAGKWNDKPE